MVGFVGHYSHSKLTGSPGSGIRTRDVVSPLLGLHSHGLRRGRLWTVFNMLVTNRIAAKGSPAVGWDLQVFHIPESGVQWAIEFARGQASFFQRRKSRSPSDLAIISASFKDRRGDAADRHRMPFRAEGHGWLQGKEESYPTTSPGDVGQGALGPEDPGTEGRPWGTLQRNLEGQNQRFHAGDWPDGRSADRLWEKIHIKGPDWGAAIPRMASVTPERQQRHLHDQLPPSEAQIF